MTAQEFLKSIEDGTAPTSTFPCTVGMIRTINEKFYEAAWDSGGDNALRTFHLAIRQYYLLNKCSYPKTCSEYVAGITRVAMKLIQKGG